MEVKPNSDLRVLRSLGGGINSLRGKNNKKKSVRKV